MRLPLSLDISAPLYDVLPVLALALFEADGIWDRRMLAHPTTWQWVQEQVPNPIIIELRIGQEPTDCVLHITGPLPEPDELLRYVITHMMTMFHEYKFKYKLLSLKEPKKIALFIAPHDVPYVALAPLMAQVVKKYGLHFLHPEAGAMELEQLPHLVQDASLVIGVWETLSGQNALYQSWMRQQPLLVLVRQKAIAVKWLNPLIDYSTILNAGGSLSKNDMHDVMSNVMKDTLAKQPKNIVSLDKNGINKYYRKGNSLIKLRTSL